MLRSSNDGNNNNNNNKYHFSSPPVLVIPEERGKGFGKLVMKLTEDYARKKGFTRCYLSTHDKERFYEAIGYTSCPPVCGISGTGGHMERFVRLFDGKPNEPPTKDKSFGDNRSQKVDCSEPSGQLPLPPPPPPPPRPSSQQKANVTDQVWMMKQLWKNTLGGQVNFVMLKVFAINFNAFYFRAPVKPHWKESTCASSCSDKCAQARQSWGHPGAICSINWMLRFCTANHSKKQQERGTKMQQ